MCSAQVLIELSSEFSPAKITICCTPSSTNKQQREAARMKIDTRVSVQLTKTRQPKSPPGKSNMKGPADKIQMAADFSSSPFPAIGSSKQISERQQQQLMYVPAHTIQ